MAAHEDLLDTQTRVVLQKTLMPAGERPLRSHYELLNAMMFSYNNNTTEERGRRLMREIFMKHRIDGLFSTILDPHGVGAYDRYYGVASDGWIFDGRRIVRPRLHLRVPPELSESPVHHLDIQPVEEEAKEAPQEVERKEPPRKVIYDEDFDDPFAMECDPEPEAGPEPPADPEASSDDEEPLYHVVRFTDVYLNGKVAVARWADTWHRVSELDGVFTNPSLVFRRTQALKPGYLKRVPKQGTDGDASRAKDVLKVDTRNRRILVSWQDTEVTREFFADPKDFDQLLDAFWTSKLAVKT
jgi:hypothetical protein